MLCVVVLPVGRSVVLVSRRVCLLRERSALESEEGIIVYSIYLRLRRPTGHGPCCVLILWTELLVGSKPLSKDLLGV